MKNRWNRPSSLTVSLVASCDPRNTFNPLQIAVPRASVITYATRLAFQSKSETGGFRPLADPNIVISLLPLKTSIRHPEWGCERKSACDPKRPLWCVTTDHFAGILRVKKKPVPRSICENGTTKSNTP
jgi:hypothetical protein